MKPTQIYYASPEWFSVMGRNKTELPSGRWVPSRPLGSRYGLKRLHAAWLVFSGQADALVWMEDYDQR
jgi:hypothetical protein